MVLTRVCHTTSALFFEVGTWYVFGTSTFLLLAASPAAAAPEPEPKPAGLLGDGVDDDVDADAVLGLRKWSFLQAFSYLEKLFTGSHLRNFGEEVKPPSSVRMNEEGE
jgi:hypothetical protein